MYKHIYDTFKHWYHQDKGSIWLYSDPHFNDDEMKYLRANYIGDDEQICRINSKVGRNDTLIILGDIGDTEFVKKLRGYKVLIMGNHDAGASNYKRVHTDEVRQDSYEYVPDYKKIGEEVYGAHIWKEIVTKHAFDNHLFDEVYEGPLFISDKLLLSHEPIDYPYALNIHGHDHSKWHKEDALHYNVCAEHINYTPINLKSIVNSGLLKPIDSIHRATINEATAKKLSR